VCLLNAAHPGGRGVCGWVAKKMRGHDPQPNICGCWLGKEKKDIEQ